MDASGWRNALGNRRAPEVTTHVMSACLGIVFRFIADSRFWRHWPLTRKNRANFRVLLNISVLGGTATAKKRSL